MSNNISNNSSSHRIFYDNNSSSRFISRLVSERPKHSSWTREMMMEDFQNENIKLLCGLNAITNENIKLLCDLNAITNKNIEDNQRINSAKFDKMIELLSKIAGEPT